MTKGHGSGWLLDQRKSSVHEVEKEQGREEQAPRRGERAGQAGEGRGETGGCLPTSCSSW